MGVEQGIVRKSGAWYTYEGDQLGQGKENARTFLRDNPDIANEIEKKIKEKLGVGPRLDAEPRHRQRQCRQRQRQRQRQCCQRQPCRRRLPRRGTPPVGQRGQRQWGIVVPGRRHRSGCHGLAHDPYGPGFRVRERGASAAAARGARDPKPRPLRPGTLKPGPGRYACGC